MAEDEAVLLAKQGNTAAAGEASSTSDKWRHRAAKVKWHSSFCPPKTGEVSVLHTWKAASGVPA